MRKSGIASTIEVTTGIRRRSSKQTVAVGRVVAREQRRRAAARALSRRTISPESGRPSWCAARSRRPSAFARRRDTDASSVGRLLSLHEPGLRFAGEPGEINRPPESREPDNGRLDLRDVQDRRDGLHTHGRRYNRSGSYDVRRCARPLPSLSHEGARRSPGIPGGHRQARPVPGRWRATSPRRAPP